mgnify:CR=1 FL=1
MCKVINLAEYREKKNKNYLIDKNDRLDLFNHEFLSQIGFSTRDFRLYEKAIYEDPEFAKILEDLLELRNNIIIKLQEAIEYTR